jgi:hypothetical protein
MRLTPLIIGSGLILLCGCAPVLPVAQETAASSSVTEDTYAPTTAREVRTDGWVSHTSAKLGFTILAPAAYSFTESGGGVSMKGPNGTIAFGHVRSSVAAEVGKHFSSFTVLVEQVTHLISDNTVAGAAMHFSTGEAGSVSVDYYLAPYDNVNPLGEHPASYEVLSAHAEGAQEEGHWTLEPDGLPALAEVEQIMSTIRLGK